MSKSEELELIFNKKVLEDGYTNYFLDAGSASNQNKGLIFIQSLNKLEIEHLIESISLIQHGQTFDPDFLTASEVYLVFNVQFVYPFFHVDGIQTIHMDDLKLLLLEWLAFINR